MKRGLLLVVLEVTVILFSWVETFPPHTIWLQVIWVIGYDLSRGAPVGRRVILGVLMATAGAFRLGLVARFDVGHRQPVQPVQPVTRAASTG